MTQPLPGAVSIIATPPQAIDGTTVEFAGTFYNPLTGAVGDPAEVAFSFAAGTATPTNYTYGVDAELVKDAIGKYHVVVDTTGTAPAGDKIDLVGQFDGKDNESGTIQAVGSVTVPVYADALPDPL